MRELIKEILANPIAMMLAILVHVVLGVILFVSFEWIDVATPLQPKVDIVNAVAIDEKKIQEEVNRLKKAEAKKQKKQLKLDKKAKDAEKKRKLEEKRLAKLRKEREAEKKRLAAIEKKQKQLEDRKRRAAEAEVIQQAIEKEQAALIAEQEKLAAAEAARQAALARENEKRLSTIRGQYIADIQSKVARNWIKPASAKPGLSCKVVVNQIPGGEVINVKAIKCTGDEIFRRSVEAAVYKASPLPRPSDPELFDREIVFTFKPK